MRHIIVHSEILSFLLAFPYTEYKRADLIYPSKESPREQKAILSASPFFFFPSELGIRKQRKKKGTCLVSRIGKWRSFYQRHKQEPISGGTRKLQAPPPPPVFLARRLKKKG